MTTLDRAPTREEKRAPRRTWRQVAARVRSQREYGAGFRWLELDVPAPFTAPVAGQFVQLLLDFPSPVLLPRPMSVAGVRRRSGGLGLGFLYGPVGPGTRALARLEPGATVHVTGPLGRGYPLEEPGTPVLVAGGRGVAPLLFAAETLARARRRCTFLFGARSRALLVGLAEARARAAGSTWPRTTAAGAFTATSCSSWTGRRRASRRRSCTHAGLTACSPPWRAGPWRRGRARTWPWRA